MRGGGGASVAIEHHDDGGAGRRGGLRTGLAALGGDMEIFALDGARRWRRGLAGEIDAGHGLIDVQVSELSRGRVDAIEIEEPEGGVAGSLNFGG